MPKHRSDLTKGVPLPSTWVNALMEFVSTMASANFAVKKNTNTTVQVVAGSGDDQVTVGIDGRWRYNVATVTATHPGGVLGTYDVYVTAADNDFSLADPLDATNYTFGLAIRAAGSPPATALYRKVATLAWDGAAITGVQPIVGVMPHAASHQPGGSDALAVDAAAATGSLRTLGTGANQAAAGSDARLSDQRTPSDNSVTNAKVSGTAAIAESKLNLASDAAAGTASRRSLGAGATQAAAGNDSRLSDQRVPTDGSVTDAKVAGGAAIAESKLTLASDAVAGTASRRTLGTGAQQAAAGNDSRLTNARTPTAHASTHQPGGSDAMAVDAAAATGSLRTLGAGAAQAAPGNDSRLSDARTPTAHATTHQPGGGDAMAVDAAVGTGSLRTLGTGALQAAAGNDARLSDFRLPSDASVTWLKTGVDLQGLARGSFSAYLSADMGPVVSGTDTTLTGLTEEFDPGGDFNPVTGVYTTPYAGVYEFSCFISWGLVAAGQRVFAVLCRSDNTQLRMLDQRRQSANPDTLYLVGLTKIKLAAGDNVIVRTRCDDPTARNILGGAGGHNVTRIAGMLLGRTT